MRHYVTIIFFILVCSGAVLAEDISGKWAFEAVIDATECEEGIKKEELDVSITQKGDKVTFSFGDAVLKGVLVGNKLTLKGKYQDQGTVSKDLTFVVTDGQMKGGGNWTYTVEGFTCKGTEKLEGIRL